MPVRCSLSSLALAASFSVAVPALAQDEEADAAAPAQASEDDSSAGNRKGKIVSVGVDVGFAIAPLPAGGFAAGWYAMPDLLAEVAYVSGGFEVTEIGIDYSLAELRAKYWLGNSFFVNAGLGQRTIKFKAELDASTAGLPKLKTSLQANTTGLSFGIGNRWQWDNFSLGFDWLGYFLALSSSGDTDINLPGAAEKDKKDLKELVDKLAETSHVQTLRLFLGVSF